MQLLKKSNQLLKQSFFSNVLFWALVFLLNTGPHWEIYSSLIELVETVGLITGLQFLVAYFAIKVLVPVLLNENKKVLFFMSMLLLLFVAAEINIAVRYFYIEPVYPDSYAGFTKLYGHMSFRQRMLSLWTMKYIFFTKIPLYLFPSVILMANNFHNKQKDLLRLSEEKRKAELSALKNQLNPHFIFNTLNNLYVLALKKSDQTPMVIEKLSDILDYILYRCNDKFVSLFNEIKLIENYIALEKIRYGKRLSVTFEYNVNEDVKIAPLILLTLLENACKHSTSQELNKANVNICLEASRDEIQFKIENSKPAQLNSNQKSNKKIGLANTKKQLDLIYAQSYDLKIDETVNYYKIKLTLRDL